MILLHEKLKYRNKLIRNFIIVTAVLIFIFIKERFKLEITLSVSYFVYFMYLTAVFNVLIIPINYVKFIEYSEAYKKWLAIKSD